MLLCDKCAYGDFCYKVYIDYFLECEYYKYAPKDFFDDEEED